MDGHSKGKDGAGRAQGRAARFCAGRCGAACAAALGAARRHPAVVFVGAILVAFLVFAALPGRTAGGLVAQSVALAAVGLAAAGLVREGALGRGRGGEGEGRAADVADRRRARRWGAYLLLVGLAAGLASAAAIALGASDPADAAGGISVAFEGPAPLLLFAALLLCALAGVFEEGLFRVAAVEAIEDALSPDARATLKAAIASAVLFGILHISTEDVAAAESAVAALQCLLKPLQAGLFGFCLAAAYARSRSLWPIAGFHALFDLVYLAPAMLAGGALSTSYVTGSPLDLALLAATIALLAPPTAAAGASLGRARPAPSPQSRD